jgi:hypothetical protein
MEQEIKQAVMISIAETKKRHRETKFQQRGKKSKNGFGKRKKSPKAGHWGLTDDNKTLSDNGKIKVGIKNIKEKLGINKQKKLF